MKTQLKKIFFINFLILYGISLFSCKNWNCLDCNTAFLPPNPWFISAKEGDIERAEFLLKEGTDIHERNYTQQTALHVASINGQADMVLFLINKGANTNAKAEGGFTALHEAKTVEVAEVLLNNGADINAKTTHNETPLHKSIELNKTELSLFLIKQGANVNIKDKEDWTSLLLALEKNEKEVAKFLFQKGANPYIKNKYGNSAYSYVELRGNQEFIDLFKAYNLSDNVK